MAQQVQAKGQEPLRLKELGIAEVLALAIHRKRAMEKKGKTTRRVTLSLAPWQIPPRSGVYSTYLGDVKIYSVFRAEEGRWIVMVKLPITEGFTVKDHIAQKPSPSPSQTETPTQS